MSNGQPVEAPLSAVWERFFRTCPDQACDSAAVPWLIGASDWQRIESGVQQRARLLQEIMTDVYGPQQLVDEGLLPAELVFGQPGYLRAMHGVNPVGGSHLRILAFDLVHQPSGAWGVLREHCQVPAGWGHLLSNRARSADLLPAALEALPVRALAASLDALLNALQPSCAPEAEMPLALLSPGHGHPDYAEHSRLARELSLALLRASELTVHDQALYVKALHGLVRAPALIKLLGDDELDPLEVRCDSQSGVPGLLQTLRAGKLRLANAPGSALLETPLLRACLPALSHHLLGAELALSSVEADAELAQRHASQLPVWHSSAGARAGEWRMSSVTLRVFAWTDSQRAWHVLPGGLACVAVASSHGSDVWVMGAEKCAPSDPAPERLPRSQRWPGPLSRRAGEQLFWLGRYSQRCAHVAALAGLTTKRLTAASASSPALLVWLGNMALQNGLLAADGSMPWVDPHTFDAALGDRLEPALGRGALADKLCEAITTAADALEHLPEEHEQAMDDALALVMARSGPPEPGALGAAGRAAWLEEVSAQLATIIALQTGDRVPDPVRRLLGIGQGVERLGFQLAALRAALACGSLATLEGLEALHELFDAEAATRSCAGPCASPPALLASLLTGAVEMTSIGASAQTLRARLAAQDGLAPDPLCRLASRVPDPLRWVLKPDSMAQLSELLLQCQSDIFELSNAICSICTSEPTELPPSA